MKYVKNAVKVFLDTGTRFPRRIIWAMGMVKYAAASANMELGLLDEKRGEAIKEVALKLADGAYDDLIVVDVFQTGSGTGLNMNVNEVIAAEASKIAGVEVHPNDHVNKSQSSNDVVPTAIRVAALAEALWRVKPALGQLIASLANAASRFEDAVKPGRTHLRDALPVTLGQELDAFRRALEADMRLLDSALDLVRLVPLGGTAVGTGLNAHPDYPRLAVAKLAEATGLPLEQAESRFRAMRLLTDLVSLSGAYRAIALDLWRLGQDLRLMYSGPNTGLAEIDMPQAVPGSSMMPGKVNPVTVEAVMQASAQVAGLDQANSMANLLGELELSMGIPLVGYNVVTQSVLLGESLSKLSSLVVDRIEARRERMARLAESSQALVTVLAPVIGYDKAAELSRLMGEGRSIREALEELGYTREEVDKLLDLRRLTRPGIPALDL
ncbi:MAG: class II fumarate hydratase [Desulfurococcales archaeon]|nr:class II fumarate hydratase [Desulfurococcales archaeon]